MRNASSLKSKAETPKTPGGISKSLLTPCRRVGLSRNWRKSIASPFNSPLASTEEKQNNVETRKRKESLEETPLNTGTDCQQPENGTPTRKVVLPRRKKSKTLLNSITKTCEDDSSQPGAPDSPKPEVTKEKVEESKYNEIEASEVIATPVRLKSRSKSKVSAIKVTAKGTKDGISEDSTPAHLKYKNNSKKIYPTNNTNTDTNPVSIKSNDLMDIVKENVESNKLSENKSNEKKTEPEKENSDTIQSKNKERKGISPNYLTKECVVVIQKKIFKKQLQENELLEKVTSIEPKNTVSQALFNDSDSDDIPLNHLNKPETKKYVETITIDDDDDDFATSKSKLKKTSSKISTKEKIDTKAKSTIKDVPKESYKTVVNVCNPPSQSSVDDDDDFFEKKRTILVRKTYDKVIKPLKAKSTGSITQKDIEDLKARIEIKKKMLLAKSMTDTKELRELIKKWQKGCQDALMELMELMKMKCPDQNMEYSQFLQTLKIPAALVGYDSDNDCFVTPEDENIILSHLK